MNAPTTIGRPTTKVATRFSQLSVMPRARDTKAPLSSGLNARDLFACVTQASTKCRKAPHDEPRLRHSLRKVNGGIRGDDQTVCLQSGGGSCPR
jgi:hypothetical protein